MPRVRVVLKDVECIRPDFTEDWTYDSFYLKGVITDGTEEHTKAVYTRPVDIRKNQTKRFGEGGGTVFDMDLPDDGTILKVILNAFDKESGLDLWNRRKEDINNIINKVSEGLKLIPNPKAAVAGALLPYLKDAAGFAISIDQDDDLGTHLGEYLIGELSPGENGPQSPVFEGDTLTGDWTYKVNYYIVKR